MGGARPATTGPAYADHRIDHEPAPLVALPPQLQSLADRARQAFTSDQEGLPESLRAAFDGWPDERKQAFLRVCAASDFVAEQTRRDPAMLMQLAESGELECTLKMVNCVQIWIQSSPPVRVRTSWRTT